MDNLSFGVGMKLLLVSSWKCWCGPFEKNWNRPVPLLFSPWTEWRQKPHSPGKEGEPTREASILMVSDHGPLSPGHGGECWKFILWGFRCPIESSLKKINVTADLALPFGQTPAIALYFWFHHIRRSALLSLKLSLSATLYISILSDLELSRGTLDHWEWAEW